MTAQSSKPDRPPSNKADIDEQAITWFVRLRANNVTLEERQNFKRWLAAHPDHHRAYQGVARLWGEKELALAVEKTAARIDLQQSPAAAPIRRHRLRATAAAAICLIGLLSFALPEINLYLQQDFSTASGQLQRIELADGSLLTLNTDSAVDVDYSDGQRRIRLLKGEALFDVQPDKQRPFVVESDGVTAQAVGTRYLVRRYAQGLLVDVQQGIVEVKAKQRESLQLQPNQQLRIDDDSPYAAVPSDPADSAWLQGRLVFDNTRLSDALDEIGRYHPGLLALANPRIGELRVSGSFTLTDPRAILETLEQTLPISLLRLTDRVILVY